MGDGAGMSKAKRARNRKSTALEILNPSKCWYLAYKRASGPSEWASKEAEQVYGRAITAINTCTKLGQLQSNGQILMMLQLQLPKTMAEALDRAKQAGADSEQRRVLAIVKNFEISGEVTRAIRGAR